MKKHVVPDLSPGPLPGHVISWRCWRLEGRAERIEEWRRAGEPVEVEARTAVVAKAEACCLLRCEPHRVDVEPVFTEKHERRVTTDGILTPTEREAYESLQFEKNDGRLSDETVRELLPEDEDLTEGELVEVLKRIDALPKSRPNGESRLQIGFSQISDFFKKLKR